MDNVQAARDQASRIQKINEKYGRMMEEIAEIQRYIDEAPQKFADRSAEFINDKLAVANAKIEKCRKAAEDWLQKAMQDAQDWVKAQQDKIQEQAQRALEELIIGKNQYNS